MEQITQQDFMFHYAKKKCNYNNMELVILKKDEMAEQMKIDLSKSLILLYGNNNTGKRRFMFYLKEAMLNGNESGSLKINGWDCLMAKHFVYLDLFRMGRIPSVEHLDENDNVFGQLACMLDRTIIGGVPVVHRSYAYYIEDYKEENGTGLLASPVVDSLSPLSAYLRYNASGGDYVLLEYPETGLCAELQIKLARLLIRMCNAGIHLILTTHSEYIIREFNNMISLSDLSDELVNKLRRQFHYMPNEHIRPWEVSVFKFGIPVEDDMYSIEEVPVSELGYNLYESDTVLRNHWKQSESIYMELKNSKQAL